MHKFSLQVLKAWYDDNERHRDILYSEMSIIFLSYVIKQKFNPRNDVINDIIVT